MEGPHLLNAAAAAAAGLLEERGGAAWRRPTLPPRVGDLEAVFKHLEEYPETEDEGSPLTTGSWRTLMAVLRGGREETEDLTERPELVMMPPGRMVVLPAVVADGAPGSELIPEDRVEEHGKPETPREYSPPRECSPPQDGVELLLDASQAAVEVMPAAVLFPFLVPVLDKMNVNLFPKDFLDFFMNAITSFKEKRQKGVHAGRVDFLQLMLDSRTNDVNSLSGERKALTDEEIMAQSLIYLYSLGMRPQVCHFPFLFYNLATHPDVQQKLQEEIDSHFPEKATAPPTYDTLMQMEYLDMVIQETLRMYPPAERLERVSKQNVEIHGVVIPKGTVNVLHMNPEIWPEPEEFRPERFSKENKANHDPYTFLPFGEGPRNCIGMRFALLSMKLAITVLLQNFTFRPCKDPLIPTEFSTKGFMQPKKPIALQVISRNNQE